MRTANDRLGKDHDVSPNDDWRTHLVDEEDPDDELLPETPADVIAILGFDPLEDDRVTRLYG